MTRPAHLLLRTLAGAAIAAATAGAGGCLLDLQPVVSCGDGYVDASAGEECEPGLADSWSDACEQLGLGGHGGGCDPVTCTLEANKEICPLCGDGVIHELTEECDGNLVPCPSLVGFADCTSTCTLDFSACERCGDGVLDETDDEECDYNASDACEGDEDCAEGEICDPESSTCIEPGGVAPYLPCSALTEVTAIGILPDKHYVSGVIDPNSCTDQCQWDRSHCGLCGDDELDGAYTDIGPTGDYINMVAETCDGEAVPGSLAEAFCEEHCTSGATELTFGCQYECREDCRGLRPPDGVPEDAPVGDPAFACCLAGGASCAAAEPDYPCCWALDPENTGTGCNPVYSPGNEDPIDFRCAHE